jgi:uncharacterized repeat protein (TIGR01451 family)
MKPTCLGWVGRQRGDWRIIWGAMLLLAVRPIQAQASAVDHFSWGAVPATVQVGQSFAAAVQARDLDNNLVTSFNGSVMLTALVPNPSPTLLITEVETISTKRVELSNVSTNPVDISGWRVFFYDSASWPAPKASFTLPAGTVCPGLGVFQVRSAGSYPGSYPVFYTGIGLTWGGINFNTQVAVLLLDARGNTVDFFCAGDAYPALIAVPAAIGISTWAGLPVAVNANFTLTHQRGGHSDANTAADWATVTNTAGAYNPRLQSPFVSAPSVSALQPGSVTLTNGVWSGQVAVMLAGSNVVLNADDGNGDNGLSGPLTVVGLPALGLQVPHQAFKATPGLLGQGTVTIPQPLSTNLAVVLSSSLINSIVVPPSVTVPAGATSVSFSLTNLDDGLIEGPQAALIIAAGPGFAGSSEAVTNYDRPPVALSVSLPLTVSEATGWVGTGQIQVSAPVAADVAVRLTSGNPSRIAVPDFAIIPAGQSSASFGFAPIDNNVIEGLQPVTINATVAGWTGGQGQVLVSDNESSSLTLSLLLQVNEGAGVLTNAGTIQIGGIMMTNLKVALTSDLPARLQLPSSVTIVAGQSSALFDVTVPEDALTNGNQLATVTASAYGLNPATKRVWVVDNDVAAFSFAGLPVAEVGGQPFPVTIYALNASGSAVPGYSATVNLRAGNAGGNVGVAPSIIGPFTNGVWSGLVTVNGANQGVALTADDGSGHPGSSSPMDVVAGQALALPVSDIAYDALRGRLWAGIQTGGGTNAQSIVSIDPMSGALDTPIPLGTAPGKLAMSDDGQFLYVALMTTGGVARVNLNTRAVDLRFALPPGSGTFATEMAVPPGDAHALVLQMSGATAATALFRDGVLKTNIVGPYFYTSEYHFAFYDSRTNFFSIYPGGLRWHNLVSNGVTLVREVLDPQYGGGFVYAGGLFFGSASAVYDPQNFRLLGAYPASGPMAADANAGQVFFVSGITLQAFDLPTFAGTGQINLPIASGSAYKVLRCGGNVLAIATTTTNLLLVQTALVRQAAAADLSVAQSPSAGTALVGSNFTYSITVSNAGPAAATNATLIDVLPADTSLVSASSPQGSWGNTNGILYYSLGGLSNGASVTVQFTVQPLTPGSLVNSAWITGDGLNPANGSSRITNTVVFGSVLPAVTRLWFNSDTLAYDSARSLLWASTERYNGAVDCSLRSISLSSGLVGTAISLGYPSVLIALSADQNYLYAAYVNDQDGLNYTPDNYIRRANLASNAIDEEFPVVDMWGQQHTAADLLGISSYPSGIIVARSGLQDDIALYQNGVAIRRAPTGTGAGKLAANSNLPTRFYRLGSGDFYGNIAQLDIGSSAISVLGANTIFALPSSPDNPVAADIRFGGGLLFSDIGLVGDPEALTRVAALPVFGLVETDPAAGLAFYLTANGSQWFLMAFDMHTFVPLWTFPVPGVSGTPARLIKCGAGLLAFRTSYDQLFILNPSQMPHLLQSDLQLTASASATATITNIPVTFSSTVVNAGPAPATSVFLTNRFPPDAILVGITPSRGTFLSISNTVVCSFGDLKAGGSAGLQMVASLNHAGTITNLAAVAQSTPDAITTNNAAAVAVDFSVIPVSDLSLTHLAPTPPSGPGSNWVYTLVVSNAGPNAAPNVVLSDTVYSGASLLSATASQGTVSVASGSLTASLGAISAGATANVSLVLGPCCGGACVNEAGVGSDNLDPNPNDNQILNVLSFSGQVFVDEIPIPAADIVYDPVQPGILASLSAALGPLSQSIVRFDLRSGTVREPVSVGNQLGRLALSDDSRYLYVALTDTGGVARVDLPARAVDLRFPLNVPTAEFGPFQVEDLAVMPGAPNTLAAARGGYSGYSSAIALFDDGIQRPDTFDNQIQYASYFRLQFASTTNLYSTAPYGFQTVAVTPTGLTKQGPLLANYAGEFAADSGLVFLGSGSVLNPDTGSLVATFPASGLVAPSVADGRVYFLMAQGNPYDPRLNLKAFDALTQRELWSVYFNPAIGSMARFIKLGTNGLAFITDANRMFWVRPPALATPTADLSLQQTLSPNPVTVGGPLTSTFSVHNYGPWTASGVILSNPIPSNATFLSASSTQGSCTFTNGTLLCAAGSLINGATMTVTVNLTASAPGAITNLASVTQNELDPNPANNSAGASATVIPQPSATIRDAVVIQGTNTKATISFSLTLSGASSVPVSVAYQTADGTALAGQDYDAASGVVTFSAGITARTLSLSIIRTNAAMQPLAFFYLNLTSVTNATLARTQAVGTIIKRVFETISITGTSVVSRSSAVTNALFKLSLNQTSSVPVIVQYQTLDGSALAGSDYESKAGTLLFSPGVTNLTLAVPVYASPVWQPTKTFSVLLSQPQQAVLGVDEALGTILNSNTVPPLAIINPPRSQTANPGASVTFDVSAVGNPLPLIYQWQFNGTNIGGATGSALNLTNVQMVNAGIYTVVVGNAGGVFTNASAVLRVPVALNFACEANTFVLTWTGPYTLQVASNAIGPFLDLSSATSPYTNPIGFEPKRFFRLRAAVDGIISAVLSPNGQAVIEGSGVPGHD